MYKLSTFEELEKLKDKLKKLDSTTEEQLFFIYRPGDEDELMFRDGKAIELTYNYNIGLATKMVIRLRNSGDICYFWNAVDPYNRELLLTSVGLTGRMIGMDFFIWLANTNGQWEMGKLQKSCIETYFEASEDQKRVWLAEYGKTMDGFPCF